MLPTDSLPKDRVNFYRNYNRVVGVAYLAIVVLTLGFFFQQIKKKHEEEIAAIQGHVERHSQFIEFGLRSSLDALDALRTVAQGHYAALPVAAVPAPSATFKLLRETPDASSFDLNALTDRDSGGNLTGQGRLTGRSARFYQDAEMALGLNLTFQSITFNLPSAAEASFCSVENFCISSPWENASKRHFDPAHYARPVWQMGLPVNNPNREKYWAPAHYGGKERGLLVPVGAPVYQSKTAQDPGFRGVISIETSLDYLNRINADFGYTPGTVFLVDAQGAVLAHPLLLKTALEAQTPLSLAQALPAAVLSGHAQLLDLPVGLPHQVAGHLVLRHRFVSAPWDLVYTVPDRELWLKLLHERGGAMLAMFLGLTALMIVAYTITIREFIAPATRLVQHLAAESAFQPIPVPRVPGAWRPWFNTISQVFRESLQLMGIRQELDIAAKMQQAILPRHWPVHADFSLWGSMRSAKEVGGDFYDHFPLDGGKTGLVVADVSGKGVPAALFGMVSKTLLRATATQHITDPGAVVGAVNDSLCQDNDTCMFVTALYAVYDPANNEVTFVNAGHPPPLLVHADGSCEFLPATDGIVLGVADGITYSHASVRLTPGDCLVIYTDGVTEAFNPQNQEFGQERLPTIFSLQHKAGAQEVVNQVIAAVDTFAAGAPQSDDVTCVVLHVHPEHVPQEPALTKEYLA